MRVTPRRFALVHLLRSAHLPQNRVTIFSDGIRTYIDRNASIGDLVRVEGRMRDSSYEKDGETIYTVDRIANEFGILASKAEAQG